MWQPVFGKNESQMQMQFLPHLCLPAPLFTELSMKEMGFEVRLQISSTW